MPAALVSRSGSSGVAAVMWGGAPAGFSPVKAKPAFTCGRWLPSLERPKPEHNRLFSDRLSENLVIVGKLAEQRGINSRDIANNRARRQPVWLGEQDIECDGGRAHVREPVDQFGYPVARPRPLAELAQRGLVDVDDPNRQILESPRRDALVLVERRVADQLQRPRVAGPQDRERRHDAQAHDDADLLGACHDRSTWPPSNRNPLDLCPPPLPAFRHAVALRCIFVAICAILNRRRTTSREGSS